MRYVLDFGSANTGGAPSFSVFARADTLAAITPPPFVEVGAGLYLFDYDWIASPTTSVAYKATLNGVELSDVISSGASALSASGAVATPAETSLVGYTTAKDIINRAAVQCGLAPVDDPLASQDVNYLQLVEFLNTLGEDLTEEIQLHFEREFTITTAGGAKSYALPPDYCEMIDDTLWNNSGIYPLSGPITPQEERFLHAWNGVTTVRIPFRILGNRITFPVAPGDGLIITGLYHSRYWVQTASSLTGPDAERVTASSDYVVFDPQVVVLGLRFKWLAAKGFDTTFALADYEKRLEWAKGAIGGARALSLNGRGNSGFRFVDNFNLPVTGWGLS